MAYLKFKVLCAALVLFALAGTSSAKPWRGIVPIQSSRADVVHLFRQCADSSLDCEFDLGNEHVRMVFSGKSRGDFDGCARELPIGRVLLIEVTLKKPIKLRDSRIRLNNFRKFQPSSPPNQEYAGYLSDKEGLILKTFGGDILQIDHIASSQDKHLCSNYYENPEAFVHVGLFWDCPPIALTGPSRVRAGDQLVISAQSVEDSGMTFTWSITGGKIISGQGTRTITIDVTGLDGKVITITAELAGTLCPSRDSCSVEIIR